MSEHMTESGEQCRYMRVAYPDLTGDETCTEHRHDAATFGLATALATTWQEAAPPTDEMVAWVLDDAAAIVDDFDPKPETWDVSPTQNTTESGLLLTFTVNGSEYVIQDADYGPVNPVRRAEWDEWQREDDEDDS